MRVVIAPRVLLAVAVASAMACSDPAARVSLVRIDPHGDGCGAPQMATELRVIAYTGGGEIARAVPIGGAIEIADFPDDTEQLGVEVRTGGGVIGAIGKTAPLELAALRTGSTVPVFMAPPDRFCRTGDMAEARIAPLVARAGDGVLVVGGTSADGRPLTTAERYDPATGTFVPVEVPEVLGEAGFAGATLTTLADGRVVVSGGPQPVATIYDPETQAFAPSVLIQSRAFHLGIASDDDELVLAGGCSAVAAGACDGVVRLSSKRYEVLDSNAVRETAPGPNLRAGRIGATLVDIGVQLDGRRTFVAAGGSAPPGSALPADAADRFALDTADAVALSGSLAQAAALDGGAVLTAFAPDGAVPSGAAAVFAPDETAARPVATAPAGDAMRLVTLEDGRVLAIGGTATSDVVRYDPMLDEWQRLDPLAEADGTAIPFAAPSLVRVADGSVLVLGGNIGGTATNRAWIFRPSLVGPASGSITVVPNGGARTNVLTPANPDTVTRGADWLLATGSTDLARALVGGPRFEDGSVRAVVRVQAGGVGLVAQQLGPGQALVVELVPGEAARVVRFAEGARRTLCSGSTVDVFGTAASIVELAIANEQAAVRRDGAVVATCEVGSAAGGAWGVAAVGPGAAVAIDTVTVAR